MKVQQIVFKRTFLPLPFIFLIAMILLSFWHGKLIPGQIIFARQEVTKYGIIEAVLLAAALFFMFIMATVKKVSFTIKKEHKTVFALMLVWVLISIVALLEGVAFENNSNYIMGDFYKFVRFPLVFFFVYFLTKSIRQIYSLYFVLILIWIVFALAEIWQFRGEIVYGVRLTSYSVLAGGRFLPIALVFTQLNLRKSFKILVWFAVILACITPIISQTRGGVINLLLALIIFFYLSKKCGVKMIAKTNYLTPLLYFGVILLVLLSIFAVKDFLESPLSGLTYRFSQIRHSETKLTISLIKMGGSRVPEALAILDGFSNSPERIIGGFGLGSCYQGDTVSGHFVHIGLAEMFFRMGAIGLILFFWIFVYFAKYALSRIKSNPHFLLPSVIAIVSLVGIFLGANPLTANPIYTAPVFAGMLKISPEEL